MANIVDTKQQFTADKLQARKDAANLNKANGTNPKSQLDKDAFMKLLLTELQYQDPTSPMDTEKMLTQTSQLATLEMQENTNQAMKELVSQLKTNSSMYALSALGKMASLGTDSFVLKEGDKSIDIPIYFENGAKSGVLQILDGSASNAKVIREIPFESLNPGTNKIKWDTLKGDGSIAQQGAYSIKVGYVDPKTNAYRTAKYGEYPVESVKFIDGKANIKIAGEYKPVDEIAEFYEPRANQRQSISNTQGEQNKPTNTNPAVATNKPSPEAIRDLVSNLETEANADRVAERATEAAYENING